ncbi:hypothetical protein [Moritella viscosa]|uniref:Two-component, sensor histidine protein kinase n=1 Tax=Moritella viscosa TaxID=80854 RepID=A0A1L0C881_9GAMM|nr:hypothetical protein [Moritella viscosa]SGZ17464.1 Two-component, sensor histidine protein kinase [Moritella viscosa]
MSITKQVAEANVIAFLEHFKIMNGLSPLTIAGLATSPEGINILTGADLLESKVYESSVVFGTAVHAEFTKDFSRTVMVANPLFNDQLPESEVNSRLIAKVITQTVMDRLSMISEFAKMPFSQVVSPQPTDKVKVDMSSENIFPSIESLTDRNAFFSMDSDGITYNKSNMVSHLVDFAMILSKVSASDTIIGDEAKIMAAKWVKLASLPYDILPIYAFTSIDEADRDVAKFPKIDSVSPVAQDGDTPAVIEVLASSQLQEFLKVHDQIKLQLPLTQLTFADISKKPVNVDFTTTSFEQTVGATDKVTADASFKAAMIALSLPVVDVESVVVMPLEAALNVAMVAAFTTPALWIASEPLLSGIKDVALDGAWADTVGKQLILDFSNVSDYRDVLATGVIIEAEAVRLVTTVTE